MKIRTILGSRNCHLRAFLEKNDHVCFIFILLPIFFTSLILLKYQISDIGGAQRDSRVGHFPLIEHIAQYKTLPRPEEYSVANIPLWHFLAAWIYTIFESQNSIRIFQIFISVIGLAFFYSVILKFTTKHVALFATLALSVNGYFLASSYYPTTDGFALNLFIIFCWILDRRLKNPGTIGYLFWLNVSIALSALNRQMFLFLFIIYGLAFIGQRKLSRIILDIVPALSVVAAGFYLFYERYCQFRISDSCWPVRQSQDLYFPVLVNFSIVGFLVAMFCLPILSLNKEYGVISKTKILLTFLFVFMLYSAIGEQVIQRGNFVVGGGFYKLRERLGNGALLFDSLSVSIFILVIVIAHRKLRECRWALKAIVVVSVSSFFGPFAFQRYFEPYLLILVLIYLSSNWRDIFSGNNNRSRAWVFGLFLFQTFETALSLSLNV